MDEYNIVEHIHRFSVWTSARAVQRNFTKTSFIKNAIEITDLKKLIITPEIASNDFDKFHKHCCTQIIHSLKKSGIDTSYGRAAKIIAVYIKTSIIIKDKGKSQLSKIAHPPIDRILLTNLTKISDIKMINWTEMNESEYFTLISEIKQLAIELKLKSLWKIEKHWA
jgi:hypothetical protein